MTLVSKIFLTCIFLLAASIIAIAQTSVEFDFGVRGGAFNSGIPLEVFSNHYFPPAYSTDKMPCTFGPTVGVLINDRFDIRFEAVRSLFRFRGESTTPFPASGQKSISTTDGHMWQYPLLVTIHSSSVYITGGLDGRVSFLSIRPELRYSHWNSSLANQENQMLFSSNQIEFLVGVTVHPFRLKGR